MNVDVLGDDVSDSLAIIGMSIGKTLGGRLTPTQKAALDKVTIDLQEPKGFDFQKNMPFIIAGAAVIIGALVMFGTMKSR